MWNLEGVVKDTCGDIEWVAVREVFVKQQLVSIQDVVNIIEW